MDGSNVVLSLRESIIFAFEFTFELIILIVMPRSVHIHSNYCFWFQILVTLLHLAPKMILRKEEKIRITKKRSEVSKIRSPISSLLHSCYFEHNLKCFSGDTWLWGKIIPPLFCPDFKFDLLFNGEGGGSKEILSIMVVLLLLNEPIFFE